MFKDFTFGLTYNTSDTCTTVTLKDSRSKTLLVEACLGVGTGTPCNASLQDDVAKLSSPITALCDGTKDMGNFSYPNPYQLDVADVTQTLYLNPQNEASAITCTGYSFYTLNNYIKYQGLYIIPDHIEAFIDQIVPYGAAGSPTAKGAKYFYALTWTTHMARDLVKSFTIDPPPAKPTPVPNCEWSGLPPTVFPGINFTLTPLSIPGEPAYTMLDITYASPLGNFFVEQGLLNDWGSGLFYPLTPVMINKPASERYKYRLLQTNILVGSPWNVSTSDHYYTVTPTQFANPDHTMYTDSISVASPASPLPSETRYGRALFVYRATFTGNFQQKVVEIQVYNIQGSDTIRVAVFKENFTNLATFSGSFSYDYACAMASDVGCHFKAYVVTRSDGSFSSNFLGVKASTSILTPDTSQKHVSANFKDRSLVNVMSFTEVSITEELPNVYLDVRPEGLQRFFTNNYYYPSFYSGSLKYATFSVPFTFPTDTPTCSFELDRDGDLMLTNSTRDLTMIDLTPPLVHVSLLPPTTYVPVYRLQVTVNDQIGIGDNTCKITVGGYTDSRYRGDYYTINSSNRVAGNHSIGTYIVDINYSLAHYCHAPLTIDCADINGNMMRTTSNDYCLDRPCNALTGVFSGLPSCDALTTPPVYFSTLSYLGHSINGDGTVGITAIVSDANKFNNATLCMFDDLDNKIPSANQSCIQLNLLNTIDVNVGSYVLTGVITLAPAQSTKTYYFRVTYSIDPAQPSIILSSRDITLIASQLSQGYPNNQMTIRNIDFQPLPVDVTVKIVEDQSYDLTIQLNRLPAGNPLTNVKNITVAVHDDFAVRPRTNYTWINDKVSPGTTAMPLNMTIVKSWGSRMLAYISSMCDYNNNCEQYPMYGYYDYINLTKTQASISGNPLSDTSIMFGNGIGSGRVTIDASRMTQTPFNFTFTTTNPMDCLTASPILVVSEMGSQDCFDFHPDHCTYYGNNTFMFNGTMTLPFAWGVRGVTVSVWNIVDHFGHTTGFRVVDPAPTIVISASYHVDSAVIDYYYKTINITGVGLGGSEYTVKDQEYTASYQDSNTAIIEFGQLKPDLDKDNYIVISGTSYLLDFFYCDSSNCKHGKCIENTCQCDPDWRGEDCSISRLYTCPNNCSGNGDCVDQNCMCHNGFAGPSCNLKMDEVKVDVSFKEDLTNAVSTLGVAGDHDPKLTKDTMSVSYSISIAAILELNYLDQVVNNITLNWTLANSDSNSTKYTITNMGGIQHASNTITLTIDKYLDGGQTVWANKTLKFQPNTIKYTVNFDGYNFTSQLNYIQIIFQTVSMGDCTQLQNDTEISWGRSSRDDMHYFILPQHQMQCYGRFPTSVISDDRVVSISNKIVSVGEPLRVATSVPFFKRSAAIDPDFSVLVLYSQANSNGNGMCEASGGPKPYIIPLIVVGCVLCLVIICLALFFKLKKNMYIRQKIHKMRAKRTFGSNKLDRM
ncbi:hypothetical protein SAMD00019534_089110 [Acytostelium subglobosum LB1]|uniref:hypothetical protein n=1 Tax=Acytostelium subglobosum LB1 TaxID=1410327 RepID=UPI000644C6AF|nr:hypothetical protein SAMD00019534_089110 [Acytostelium subglobosum LB1]GAM25736.1 hypothetical protein SAMD00019534_089110 [Acytostelium subglobosum LB1]|eukprot:XP_012751254.1 hypothetical protein SAMD00019534_089110 [Acytostelium subglobosum LB1]